MDLIEIPLVQLRAHPANSNVMSDASWKKLKAHIGRTDRYPPVIVRRIVGDPAVNGTASLEYQILDGHHRVKALAELGRSVARCVVWEVDESEALVLLATLNRLQGRDDPTRRAELVDELSRIGSFDARALAAMLPEDRADVEKLIQLRQPIARPTPPPRLESMPVSVHFFLLPDQRRILESRLASLGGTREEALMQLVSGAPVTP